MLMHEKTNERANEKAGGKVNEKANARAGAPGKGSLELRVTALLTLGSGLVGLDRFIIYPLFPTMAKELHFDYRDLGLVSMALSLGWGFAAILTGPLSDRFGRKAILVPSVLIFSLLVATSGLATGLVSFVLIRIMMGLAEGAYLPASISSVTEASHPKRAGLNNGLLTMASPLFGLVLGPGIALGLMHVMPNWHYVFGVVAIPGLLTTLLIYKFLPRQFETHAAHAVVEPGALGHKSVFPLEDPRPLLHYGSVWILSVCMICWLVCQVVLSAFMPSYVTDFLHFSQKQMGICLTGLGVGAVTGMIVVPAIADHLGYKLVMGIIVLLAIPVLFTFPLSHDVMVVFWSLAYLMFAFGGATVITTGVLAPRAVPPRLIGAACGLVVGAGEIVGGAATPAVTGFLAKEYGIPVIIKVVLVSCTLALVLVLFGVRPVGARQVKAPVAVS